MKMNFQRDKSSGSFFIFIENFLLKFEKNKGFFGFLPK